MFFVTQVGKANSTPFNTYRDASEYVKRIIINSCGSKSAADYKITEKIRLLESLYWKQHSITCFRCQSRLAQFIAKTTEDASPFVYVCDNCIAEGELNDWVEVKTQQPPTIQEVRVSEAPIPVAEPYFQESVMEPKLPSLEDQIKNQLNRIKDQIKELPGLDSDDIDVLIKMSFEISIPDVIIRAE